MKQSAKRPMAVWLMVLIDLLVLAAFLSTFCYYHHIQAIWGAVDESVETEPPLMVITKPPRPDHTQVTVPVTPPSTGDDPSTPETDGPMWDMSGDFGWKFYYKFSADDEVISEANYYRSHDLCIEITKVDKTLKQKATKSSSKATDTHVIYYVAHIYLRNMENFFSAYQEGKNNAPSTLLSGTGAVFAINGDVFNTGTSSKEIIVRNGNVIRYKSYISSDICALYWDGTMETITPAEYDWNKLAAKAPYQVWSFGPELLNDDGSAKTDIESSVWRTNPRAAIGYVEPGHYVMVAVDGNRDGKTNGGVGLNMDELAKVMSEEGCVQAYNLDGGASVYCYYQGEYLVSFTKNRKISDMVCVGETR